MNSKFNTSNDHVSRQPWSYSFKGCMILHVGILCAIMFCKWFSRFVPLDLWIHHDACICIIYSYMFNLRMCIMVIQDWCQTPLQLFNWRVFPFLDWQLASVSIVFFKYFGFHLSPSCHSCFGGVQYDHTKEALASFCFGRFVSSTKTLDTHVATAKKYWPAV